MVALDATAGSGGYSKAICEAAKNITLVAIDADSEAAERTKNTLSECSCVCTVVESNFRNLDEVLDGCNIRELDVIVFDLGLSSEQLEESGRGFSFARDEPLMMTLATPEKHDGFTAYQVVNDWSKQALADIFYGYGEERAARRIATAIDEAREKGPIETTRQLVSIVEKVVPRARIHAATRTFQALRIAVNDELGALKEGLAKAVEHLKPKGRVAVVSYHSLEDRIVKHFFGELNTLGKGNVLTKKPIIPTDKEKKENPRSRSAKLRIFKKS